MFVAARSYTVSFGHSLSFRHASGLSISSALIDTYPHTYARTELDCNTNGYPGAEAGT